ncbi:MAG: lysylphosphatidylglycerol synthase transmembrane domain-containing protein [Microthrixaceae bacterium]
MAPPAPSPIPAGRPARHHGRGPASWSAGRWLQAAVLVLALAGLTWFVVAEWSEVRAALDALRDLRWGWMVPALAASIASIALFAAVRVVLLGAGGTHMGLGRATAASFASGAVAATVPAGGALATAYMVQRYREAGADAGLAAWVTVASGVVAPAVLVAMTLTGVAVAGSSPAATVVPGAVALALVVGFFAVTRRPAVLHAPTLAVVHAWHRLRRRPGADDAHAVATEFVDRFAGIRAGVPRWVAAWSLQVLSWLGEFVTLLASILAVGGTVPWGAVLAVYGTSQLAGAIPLVPGGAGQVEAVLVVGLTAAGTPTATALAAAVVFRLASHWLVVPVGWVCFGLLRRAVPPME